MTSKAHGGVFHQISNEWNDPLAVTPYETGVSLHGHTSMSEETLGFIQAMGATLPGVSRIQKHYEVHCREKFGLELNWTRANWRPPLQPRMAYDVEAEQIQQLGMYPLVSLTDHDTIEGPQLLRTLPSSRHVPISVEWSVPYGLTVLHLGIHNLPSSAGPEWMRRFAAFTAAPDDLMLMMMLRELHENRTVLIVLNHPVWDLQKVGMSIHLNEVLRFLSEARSCIHALELNGLRHAKENREVIKLARETERLLISGGDRHGLEPNAIINLTSASNFSDFVEEIRWERRSHVHFMNQYRKKWEQRILASTLVAIRDYPQFMPGWQRWDERAFHPDKDGQMRPLSELWPTGRPPKAVRFTIGLVRSLGMRGVSAPLSLAFPGVNELGPEMEWG